MYKYCLEVWGLPFKSAWDSFRPIGYIDKENKALEKECDESKIMTFDTYDEANEWRKTQAAKKWLEMSKRSSIDVVLIAQD